MLLVDFQAHHLSQICNVVKSLLCIISSTNPHQWQWLTLSREKHFQLFLRHQYYNLCGITGSHKLTLILLTDCCLLLILQILVHLLCPERISSLSSWVTLTDIVTKMLMRDCAAGGHLNSTKGTSVAPASWFSLIQANFIKPRKYPLNAVVYQAKKLNKYKRKHTVQKIWIAEFSVTQLGTTKTHLIRWSMGDIILRWISYKIRPKRQTEAIGQLYLWHRLKNHLYRLYWAL